LYDKKISRFFKQQFYWPAEYYLQKSFAEKTSEVPLFHAAIG